jgi:transcriptional regulator with XRE-family HTH domain
MEGREDIGSYVRAWRERLQPAAAGLPAGRLRRTAGLRREELASLAGISVDYLVRLEQGRATNPSSQVLAALARALRLDDEERDHLYRVAGQAPPKRTKITSHVTPGVQRLVDRLSDVPVGVFDAAWNLIAWNAPWAALMGDPSALSGRDRNILWRAFTGAPSRVRNRDVEMRDFEESAVADVRRVVGTYPDDAELRQLVSDLCRVSPRFAELWRRRSVHSRSSGRKTIVHPDVGPIELDCDVLTADGTDIRLVVYTADPSSPDADKLELVRVLGLQMVGTRNR